MRKLLVGVLGFGAIVVVAGAGTLFWIVRSLDTPAWHARMLQRVSAAAGTDVRVARIHIAPLSGVTLEQAAVANPAPFRGELLTARRLLLRYELWPLLRRQLVVDRLELDGPELAIAMDARGVLNYEKLGPRSATAERRAGIPLQLAVRQLTVDDGLITLSDERRVRLLTLSGAKLATSIALSDEGPRGSGQVSIAGANLGGMLFVRDLSAPFVLSADALRFAKLGGRVGGGRVTGEASVRFQHGFRYEATLEVAAARVETLLLEAGGRPSLRGDLRGRARLSGTGGLPTLRARGEASVGSCRVEDSATLRLLAAVFGIPELAKPDLDECRVEYELAGVRLATPVLRLEGKAFQLGGRGTLRLDTDALDYDLTLALAPALFAKITRQELRGGFDRRADGFATIDFHLSGTTVQPKTDVLTRVAAGAARGLIENQLERLLRR